MPNTNNVNRREFAASLGAAAVFFPGRVLATGGVESGGNAKETLVRVLLASGSDIASPRQLDAWHFAWNGRTYRGGFAIVPLENGKQGLVDALPLDSYLYGVVSREVSSAWPLAALQAQAILARTYVATKLRPDKQYDVVVGASNQQFGAIESETVEARAAVDATAGRLVTYRGQTASVAYSACCGGRTADPADVWHSSIPYLRSMVDPHCAGSPGYRWETNVDCDALGSLNLARCGTLRSVEMRGMTGSGRPRQLAFNGTATTVQVDTDSFRAAAGMSVVRSTYLRSILPNGNTLDIAGNGSGHGVGMCQWGARAMAATGASAADIIAFYFPTTKIV
jgi:stage II sporulation protein D